MQETRGHHWQTRWNETQTTLVSTCRFCGAVQRTTENGTCWMSQDIDPYGPCPGKDATHA